jgi:hypothetical protein
MVSKADIPVFVLGLVGIIFFVTNSYFPQPLNSTLVGTGVGIFSSAGIFAYAAYWSLTIRKGLASWIYRSQALGITLVSFAFIVQFVGNFFSLTVFATNQFLSIAGFALRADLLYLVTFYWIDSSMRTIRDTDPLSRDTLSWSKLRYLLWAANIASIAIYYALAFGDFQFLASPPAGIPSTMLVVLFPIPLVATFVPAIVVLPIGAARSKDKTLRSQLYWFALTAFIFFVGNIIAGAISSNFWEGISYGVGFVLGGYCLYRSARALVPLNKFPQKVMEKPTDSK